MVYTHPRGYEQQFTAEVDFRQSSSVTLAVFYDRYGRITFRAFADAPRGLVIRGE